jgi:hypothetical protein
MNAESQAPNGDHDIEHEKVALLGLTGQIWPISNTPETALQT